MIFFSNTPQALINEKLDLCGFLNSCCYFSGGTLSSSKHHKIMSLSTYF